VRTDPSLTPKAVPSLTDSAISRSCGGAGQSTSPMMRWTSGERFL